MSFKLFNFLTIVLFILINNGCTSYPDNSIWNDGKYFVLTGSSPELCYLINGNDFLTKAKDVSKIGSNNQIIIVETKSKGIKQYWILDKKNDGSAVDIHSILKGPMDSIHFSKELKQLHEIEIYFTEDFSF